MLCNIIQNIIESILTIYDITKPQSKDIIFQYQIAILDKKLKNLQDMVVKDLCEVKYFYHCFSKLLKRDIKTLDDYKIIERILCDYNNILVYLTNLNTIKSRLYFQFNHLKPLFIDDYSCRIIDGVVIKFDDSVYLESVKAFNYQDNEISIKEDIYYFTKKLDKSFFFVTEILNLKNINRIEISVHICVFKKNFQIMKILYV
ncbi:hypothetical protein NBO_398g0002 [Nosema bombycis CQ1]|uniref:Uncharacterized protein n=1 Tax=Nosema bombycis (strain CQ1 / CVCC 102059) TaxID=578461 RepID=R0M3K9_NOSB1|nr:hypothetical protein NBO_398g0002 [Nosema bombycis CQ1]|eukprot:EOB12604.1 hypothetical protein NBO_398g0002 [Nosema bombycis CQ1]